MVVDHDVDEDGPLVYILWNEVQGPEEYPEETHEIETIPPGRVRIQGGAIVPADVIRAEAGSEVTE